MFRVLFRMLLLKNVYENNICCYRWETRQIVDKSCALYEVRDQYPRIRHRLDSYVSKLASSILKVKGTVPLQAWTGPEGCRKLRFPDFMATEQEGDKVVSLTYRPPLPPGNAPGTHFCQRLGRPQDHSAIGRIMSMKNFNDAIWDRTSDLPICSTAP